MQPICGNHAYRGEPGYASYALEHAMDCAENDLDDTCAESIDSCAVSLGFCEVSDNESLR